MAQPEKTLILWQFNIDCNTRAHLPLLTQPQLALRCTFYIPKWLQTAGLGAQACGGDAPPQNPHQQKPAPLSPSAPDQTFPTNSSSTKQARCCIFAAKPKDFGSNGTG